MKIIQYIITLFVATIGIAAAIAEEQIVTIYSGKDKIATFSSHDISRMVIDYSPLIFPVADETAQDIISVKRSWNMPHETVYFSVCPKEFLKEYSIENGAIKVELDGLELCDPAVYNGSMATLMERTYNGKTYGIVAVHFKSPRVVTTGYVKLTIGLGEDAESVTLPVVCQPVFQFASFYGETSNKDIAAMPYLYGRPPLGTLTMYIADKCDKMIDINSSDEVRVAMNVEGGAHEEIVEAMKCYEWNLVSGDALVVTRDDAEEVSGHGFDAILGVHSGIKTGDVTFQCVTPCRTAEYPDKDLVLTLNYKVVNIKKDYPIQSIDVPDDNISLDLGTIQRINMTVTPAASYAYQKVTAVAADPTIIEVMSFEGFDLPIRALKPGTTTITFSAYNDSQLVTKTVEVKVNDVPGSIVIDRSVGDTYLFAGVTTTWTAKSYSLSGALMSNVDLTWKSSNVSVATVVNGVITALKEGNTNITAANGSIVSGTRSLVVREAPKAINAPDGFEGLYEMGNDLVFLDLDGGQLVLTNGFADRKYVGSYYLSDAYYIRDEAKAPAIGTITISKGSDTNEYIVTMFVNVNLSASKAVTFSFNNGSVYYLPE